MILHDKIETQLPAWRERIKVLVKEHADVVVDQVTVGQIVGGMRDIKSLLTDISYVDPAEGIRFRGMSIPEVLKALPKARGSRMPLVGGLYYLLMVGEVPTREEALEVEAEWAKRAEIPDYVYKMLKCMPKDIHPMIMLTHAVMVMAHNSQFTRKYHEGMKKDAYWELRAGGQPGPDGKAAGDRGVHLPDEIFWREIQAQIQPETGLRRELCPHDESGG